MRRRPVSTSRTLRCSRSRFLAAGRRGRTA
jgi:hypothetical protein